MNRRLRRKRINQLKLLMLLIVTVFVLVMLSSFAFSDNTIKGAEVTLNKSYTEVVVYYGDTIWDIAEQHYDPDYYNLKEYVNEILAINSMSNAYLEAGHTIMVPVVLE
ncbi:MAG: LysM peptidoglycan-binding domain-containing protein [Vallitaleaceae bacterium]|jgi:cell division protein YceG involved in septum cleavage|nr:LysM peptidoglycan-binding domain-containing protein [Vallitaleaceae bacterium]